MNKYIIAIIIATLWIACSSSKKAQEPQYATEEQLRDYTGPYYVIFDLFPKNSHLISMGGIGNTFDVRLLKQDNLDNFIDSFYTQLAYFPFFINDFDYKEIATCLGYNITWHIKYPKTPIISNLIVRNKFKLQDSNYVNIRIYRVLGDLDVKYVEDFKDCIMSSSIELDINKIKSINKMAVLLDKE